MEAESPAAGLRLGMDAAEPARPESEPRGLVVEELDGTVTRLAAPAADTPKAEKAPVFIERPKANPLDRKHRGEAGEWGARPHGSTRWLIGTGFGVAALVVLTLMALPAINRSNAARPAQAPPASVADEGPDEEELLLRALMVARPKVEPLVAAFASAGVAEDMLRIVRAPNEVGPLIRNARRPALVPPSWRPADTSDWVVHTKHGLSFGEMTGTYPDFTPFHIYIAWENDAFLVDWKGSTAYSSATFEELREGVGDGSEIRGVLEPSNFYTASFPEDDFRSYRLDSPDGAVSVWAYTRRESPGDAEVGALFSKGAILTPEQATARVTLRLLRGGTGSLRNQWEIGELLFPEWIEPNPHRP